MIPLLESKRKSIFLAVSSNNGISNIEGQRMSQASANQKIYNSIQRKLYQVRAEFNGRTTQRYQYTVTESKSGSV